MIYVSDYSLGENKMKRKPTAVISSIFLLTLLLVSGVGSSVCVHSEPDQTRESIIQDVRGGFGVKATISNYQLAWGNRPVRWELTVTGEHVWFGFAAGYVESMSAGVARSPIIPPTFGYGPVSVTIKVLVRAGQPDEGVISMVQRSGMMLGPFILLI